MRFVDMAPEDTSDRVTCPDDPGSRARKPFPLSYVGVSFADGSVQFVKETIDARIFEAIATIAGGEELPAGWIP